MNLYITQFFCALGEANSRGVWIVGTDGKWTGSLREERRGVSREAEDNNNIIRVFTAEVEEEQAIQHGTYELDPEVRV